MLTDTKIKQSKPADKAYRLYDMNGLYLVVNPTGTKVWRYKFRLDKKEYTYTIGKYPAVGLQQARQQAQEAKLQSSTRHQSNPRPHRATDAKYRSKRAHFQNSCPRVDKRKTYNCHACLYQGD